MISHILYNLGFDVISQVDFLMLLYIEEHLDHFPPRSNHRFEINFMNISRNVSIPYIILISQPCPNID